MLLEGNFDAKTLLENNLGQIKMTAELISEMYSKISQGMESVFIEVGRKRNDFFKIWETDAESAPLHNRTYDGLEIVRHMIISGGLPLIADQHDLQKAQGLIRTHTGIDLSFTGSAGLAGVRLLVKKKLIRQDEHCGIFFTGANINDADRPVIQDKIIQLDSDEEISKLTE